MLVRFIEHLKCLIRSLSALNSQGSSIPTCLCDASRSFIVQLYEQIVANMTKPLGITIEASTDTAELVYITSVGEQASRQL